MFGLKFIQNLFAIGIELIYQLNENKSSLCRLMREATTEMLNSELINTFRIDSMRLSIKAGDERVE